MLACEVFLMDKSIIVLKHLMGMNHKKEDGGMGEEQ
jgi:hypothetical protein